MTVVRADDVRQRNAKGGLRLTVYLPIDIVEKIQPDLDAGMSPSSLVQEAMRLYYDPLSGQARAAILRRRQEELLTELTHVEAQLEELAGEER